MASILLAFSLLSYDTIQKSRAKRAEKKAFDSTRFSELERENAARVARLQGTVSCSCRTSDWRGGGCETHGCVPAAGAPGSSELDGPAEAGGAAGEGSGTVYPPPVPEDEVRRVNEGRRKGMRAGGFTNWALKRKGRNRDRDAVVR